MGTLFLSEQDVDALLDMQATMGVVENAFKQWGAGEAANVPRHRAKGPGIVLHSMSATAAWEGMAGWKAYSTTRNGARFHVGMYDAAGELVALIQADRLGQLRTGAASGVAASYLAPPGVQELGLFGTGKQAETQLAALCVARPIRQAFVYSRNADKRVEFCQRMSDRLQISVTPVDRPAEAAEDLPIVVTATTSGTPVFDGQDVAEGALVIAAGSNWLNKAEIDVAVIRRADHIVCDDVEACRHEAGDFLPAIEAGVFDWSRAVNLADVIAGRAIGRGRHENLTLFKSVGVAVLDLAMGAELIRRARAQGRGQMLDL